MRQTQLVVTTNPEIQSNVSGTLGMLRYENIALDTSNMRATPVTRRHYPVTGGCLLAAGAIVRSFVMYRRGVPDDISSQIMRNNHDS